MTKQRKQTVSEALAKEKKENEWLKPAIIIAILALLSSVCFNFVQYKQNERTSQRARDAERRALHLEKMKTDWLDEMQRSLAATNSRIVTVYDQLRLDSLSSERSDPEARQAGLNNYDRDHAEFTALVQQKQRLRGEIDQYLANDKAP
ncbi:hypothetical protein KXD93_22290 [Mucilaginibacter sp. BJC16-A38]|uniref:hypothetical protein n=1 Tax=Mucilaginibacter phenanthrenivorans TaxID=1234842 RepID=UPI0021588DCD|nr:hypothetical protein [Mucilaginibacter phenanthrenivorans]MCR8560400.1 hypothetical protein [Mucilaginibacter phenanthrenivorans]